MPKLAGNCQICDFDATTKDMIGGGDKYLGFICLKEYGTDFVSLVLKTLCLPLYGDLVMKKVILAATVVAASASAAFAGTYDVEPVVEVAPVVIEESSSSSLGGSAALLLIGAVVVAAALASD
jgi:hypothetical protein